MTRLTRLVVLSAMSLGMVACGGAKLGGGKEGAAQAAFQASQSAGRGSQTGQGLVEKALASGAATLTLSAPCAKSGKASLVFDGSRTPSDGSIAYTINYDACSEDGKNEYNGSMTTSLKINLFESGYAGGSFVIGMKGKLEIDGEINDSIDADVKLKMSFVATSASSGSVSLVLDGYIKTESGNYTYANETIAITAGELPRS